MSADVPPLSPSRSGSGSRVMLVVGVVAVAALLIAVGLASLGGSGGASTTLGVPVTSSAAEQAAASSAPSPPWLLEEVLGLDTWNATTLPLNTSTIPANCTLSPHPSLLPSTITIPSFRGDISTGGAVFWILLYVQPSTNSSLVVLVTNGVARPLYTLAGAQCVVLPSGFTAIPANVVDSEVAARAVDQDGGAQYLAAHRTGASLEMALFATFLPESLPSLVWEFLYTPCSILTPVATGPTSALNFVATVNATSGAVVNATPVNTDCQQNLTSSPPSIFSALSLGIPQLVTGPGAGGTIATQGCTSGDYCYELSIGNATSQVEPKDFELSVNNETGVPSSIPIGYAVLDPQGQVVVYSLGAKESNWTSGVGNASTPLGLGSRICVDLGTANPSGMNYNLAIQGEGVYIDSAADYGLS